MEIDKHKATDYLLGYRGGCNDYSWVLSGPWKWVPTIPLPLDVKFSKADLKKHGIQEIESCDYYIAWRFE